jgi:AraC family ethanolamine operon transcriptional activator
MLFGEGAEFHFRNALDTVVCVVSLSLDRLAACLPSNKALPARGRSLMLRQSRPAVPALVTTTTEGIAAIKDRNGADIGGLQDRLCAEIEERLVDLIDDRTPRSIRSGPRAPHRQIFDRARHLIEENLARDQPIARLARDVGVSRRMLEYAFHTEVGVGPAHYVQRLRLNAVRHVLATEDVTVGDATARLGIWHLSRFAAQYRDLFGELPSDTLRRTQR